MNEEPNRFVNQIKRFENETVSVQTQNGKIFTGKLRAVLYTYGHAVLETDKSIMLIRSVNTIERVKP